MGYGQRNNHWGVYHRFNSVHAVSEYCNDGNTEERETMYAREETTEGEMAMNSKEMEYIREKEKNNNQWKPILAIIEEGLFLALAVLGLFAYVVWIQ